MRVNCYAVVAILALSDGYPFSDSGFGRSELCSNRGEKSTRSTEQFQSGGEIPNQQLEAANSNIE